MIKNNSSGEQMNNEDQEQDVFDARPRTKEIDFYALDPHDLKDCPCLFPWTTEDRWFWSQNTSSVLVIARNKPNCWRIASQKETIVVVFIPTHSHGWCVLGKQLDFAVENEKRDFQYQIMRLPSNHPLVKKLLAFDGFVKVGDFYSDQEKVLGTIDVISSLMPVAATDEESFNFGGYVLIPINKIAKGKDSLSQAAIIRAAMQMSIENRQKILANFF